MTPAARYAAAIELLDRVLADEPAERALTVWARSSRFAGSKDRAAVRDHVFDALRCLRSHAALGGGMTGRAVILGGLRERQEDPEAVFTGDGHAPAPLSPEERAAGRAPAGAEALDCPDWLEPELRRSLRADFEAVMELLRHRAPVFLRVNLARAAVADAQRRLASDGIATERHPLSSTALMVADGAQKVKRSAAYADGLVELQDVASQAIVEALSVAEGARVLDYCAGGGGKTLALAGLTTGQFFAHDAAPQRMRDLPARAARARIDVELTADPASAAPFDLVLCDVPCSGSGAWRRSPEGKWRLNEARLEALCRMQADILDSAATLVAPGGCLAYLTCSLLDAENSDAIEAFIGRNACWKTIVEKRLTPLDGGDGFYLAVLRR